MYPIRFHLWMTRTLSNETAGLMFCLVHEDRLVVETPLCTRSGLERNRIEDI
jgi:hypothetical protein